MGEKCLKQYQTYPECCLTSNIITSSQFSNFPNLGIKCHLPRLQSPVCGGGCKPILVFSLSLGQAEQNVKRALNISCFKKDAGNESPGIINIQYFCCCSKPTCKDISL